METPKNLREASRMIWTNDKPETTENITLGCLLRIADSSELMAKNHQQLVDERDRYKKRCEIADDNLRKLHNRIAGLKGALNRVKRTSKKK